MSFRSPRAHIVLLSSVLAASLTARPAAAPRPPTIAAASDFAFALPEIAVRQAQRVRMGDYVG
jgi:hypothetical protein